ncbi:metallophosphoesterase family protein [Flavitalea flava]
MKRRDLLKQATLGVAGLSLLSKNAIAGNTMAIEEAEASSGIPVLTIAHITDVHIHPKDKVPEKFTGILEQIKTHKVDFFLNGGDSIMSADYNDIKRERVLELWAAWDQSMKSLQSYEVFSCLGNHDMWWAAPSKEDEMYGKNYVIKRVGMPSRYYSFSKKGWHFIILDSNNANVSLDDEQFAWLEKDLGSLAAGTPVLVMSHYPILGITGNLVGGLHSDNKKLKQLFYTHRDKVKACLSGHNHLQDDCEYNGVRYLCNGAMSGFWWGKGDKESAGTGYYLETPPGYAILKLYKDGTLKNEYIPHPYE